MPFLRVYSLKKRWSLSKLFEFSGNMWLRFVIFLSLIQAIYSAVQCYIGQKLFRLVLKNVRDYSRQFEVSNRTTPYALSLSRILARWIVSGKIRATVTSHTPHIGKCLRKFSCIFNFSKIFGVEEPSCRDFYSTPSPHWCFVALLCRPE